MAPFPKMKISRANINSDMDWKSEPMKTSFENSRNGHVYFYRDKTVPAKPLTAQEISAIQQAESAQRETARAALNGARGEQNGSGDGGTSSGGHLDNGSASSTATLASKNRRKERALKIYLDCSPAKVSS